MESLFTYGTIKNISAADDYYIEGTLYDVGVYPAVVLNGASIIYGQLLAVDSGTLEELDRYEGVPSLYKRSKTTLRDVATSGNLGEVWVYEWAQETEGLEVIAKWPNYTERS